MADPVNVEDVEVFRRFRAALIAFKETADQALGHAESHLARTQLWLQGEQVAYWNGQLRKRQEAAAAAKDALRQKKLYKDSSGRTPSAVEEQKHFARCQAAVEEALQKLDACRKWRPRLEHESDLYHGGVAPLVNDVYVAIPQAVALLDRLSADLQAYAQIAAPVPVGSELVASEPPAASVARGGDNSPPIPVTPAAPAALSTGATVAPAPAPEAAAQEARDVPR